ncbi:nuclear transport factor 2 family protein [Alteromonas ponticola]|uniref:Nuclear transport factor 2 family protein n=1 Tax=Alteromonas aquimaris TaxID=2998417 RepID=A0ABT3PAH5_9ALTE|nr:nuclear transport factor 2 family protein [Alteromonas aquimaris]MCW8109758.1 nuclear transport factor 2 family protein [Alteromonas aquimaris]
MNNKYKKHISLLCTGLVMLTTSVSANDKTLKQQILQADQSFFSAFNNCDIAVMAAMFSPELEFYHDVTGLKGYDETMQSTKANCERKLGLVRTLNESTHKVYPVKNFGAIQQGEHTFCHMENGKNDCGTFGFTTVWRKSDTGWQMHRVTSYDH